MFSRLYYYFLGGLLCCGLMMPAFAAEPVLPGSHPDIVITAPQGVEYDQALDTWSGDRVTIVTGETRITADHARVDMTRRQTYAEGNVVLHSGDTVTLSDSLFYEFETGKAKFLNFRSFQSPYYISAKSAEKTAEGEYHLMDGFFTTCDYEKPHWKIHADSLEIHNGHQLVAHTVRWRIGSTSVFALPILHRDLWNKQPNWTFVPGYRSRFGPFLLSTFHWYASPHFSGELHFDERLFRGPGIGADFEYDFESVGPGKLETYYTHDDRALDREGNALDPNRYRVHWEHRLLLQYDITATAWVNYFSDDAFEKDFLERNFRENVQPDSYFEVVKRAPNWTLTLLARPRLNDFYTTTERLPELSLDLQRQPLFRSPIFYESETSVGYLHQVFADPLALPDFDSFRADTFHQLIYPHIYGNWLVLNPKVGVRGTYSSHAPTHENSDGIGRFTFNTGLEASFKLSRTWDVKSERFDLHGFRHIFQPYGEYAYIWTNRSPSEFYQFDTTYASSGRLPFKHLQPLSFPQFGQIDALNNGNVLRFGFRNKFQTYRYEQSWDLVDLDVYTDWHFNENHTVFPDAPLEQKGLSDLILDLKLKPTRWLGFRLDARYNIADNRLNELNTETRWLPCETFDIGLTTRYLEKSQAIFGGPSNLFGTDLHWKINENWGLSMSHRFEAASGTLQEQEYTVARDLHDWVVGVGVRKTGGDFRVYLLITLKAFNVRSRAG